MHGMKRFRRFFFLALLCPLLFPLSLRSQKPELIVPEGANPEFQASVLFDNGKMMALGADNQVQVFETKTGLLIKKITLPGKKIRQILLSPGEEMLAILGIGFTTLIDPSTLAVRADLQGGISTFRYERPEIIQSFNDSIRVFNYASLRYTNAFPTPRGPVYKLKTSPGNNYLLSFSLDSTLLVWDLETNRIAWEIRPEQAGILNAGISPGGGYLLLLRSDDKAILYTLSDQNPILRLDSGILERDKTFSTIGGTVYTTVPDRSKLIHNEPFSRDGRFMMIWGGEQLNVYQTGDLKLLRESMSHSVPVFSPNGQFIACEQQFDGFRRSFMLNVSDTADEKSFTLPKEDSWSFQANRSPAAFSADSRYFLNGNLEIINTQKKTVEFIIQKSVGKYDRRVRHFLDSLWIIERDNVSHIWEMNEGRILHYVPGNLKYSRDGTAVFSNEKDSSWLLAKSGSHYTLRLTQGKYSAFLSAGKILVTSGNDSVELLYLDQSAPVKINGRLIASLEKGTRSQLLVERNDSVILLNISRPLVKKELSLQGTVKAMSPDSTRLLIKRKDSYGLECWSLPLKRKLYESALPAGRSGNVYFSPNGSLFTSYDFSDFSSTEQEISLYRTETGKEVPGYFTLNKDEYLPFINWGASGAITAVSGRQPVYVNREGNKIHELWGAEMKEISRDGKLILFIVDDTLSVWNNETANKITDLPAASPYTGIISPDRAFVVSVNRGGDSLVFWSSVTGRPAISFPLSFGTRVNDLEFNKAGTRLYVKTYLPDKNQHQTIVYDYASRQARERSGIPGNEIVFENASHTIVSEPDSSQLVVYDREWNRVMQVGSESLASAYNNHFAFDPQNKILAAFNNGLLKFTHLQKGLLYNLHILGANDFLVSDERDRFDGTDKARKSLYYTCGKEIIELSQVKEALWVPGLVKLLMRGEDLGDKSTADLNICGITPLVEEREVTEEFYRFLITPRTGGLGRIAVMVNGIEVMKLEPGALIKEGSKYVFVLRRSEILDYLVPGHENPVKLIAYVADNTIHSRGFVVKEKKAADRLSIPNLYAVLIGVSDYKGEEIDLRFAAKDAKDISRTIDLVAGKLLNVDSQQHVYTYRITTDSSYLNWPSKSRIQQAFLEIGQKARAHDILLVFFAGHGVIRSDSSGGQFYFLTSDASYTSGFSADAGISMNELSEWLRPAQVKAQKRVLIFDACASGGSIRNLVKFGRPEDGHMAGRSDDKARQAKAIDELNAKSGFYVLAASASNQTAYEFDRYSQGLLTHSLLKTLKQQADILEDGKFLSVSRWFNATEKTVRELSALNGFRQEPQLYSGIDFNLGMVDDEVLRTISIAREKMLFTASNIQNYDVTVGFDNLEIGKAIDAELKGEGQWSPARKISFNQFTLDPDACFVSGRYSVMGNSVKLTAHIIQNRKIRQTFEITGDLNEVKKLALGLVGKIEEWATGAF